MVNEVGRLSIMPRIVEPDNVKDAEGAECLAEDAPGVENTQHSFTRARRCFGAETIAGFVLNALEKASRGETRRRRATAAESDVDVTLMDVPPAYGKLACSVREAGGTRCRDSEGTSEEQL